MLLEGPKAHDQALGVLAGLVMKRGFIAIVLLSACMDAAAQRMITGRAVDEVGNGIQGATVTATCTDGIAVTDSTGHFALALIGEGDCTLRIRHVSMRPLEAELAQGGTDLGALRMMTRAIELRGIEVSARDTGFGAGQLRNVEGTAIYAAKKNEVVVMDRTDGNKAVNSARQVLAKVPGLNVVESDAGGIQLGVAARGLDPNRSSNFNLRQNGYDISADALGYPEAYYTPPFEGVERIEVVRGAASLQYGPQFGGLVNFRMRAPYADGPIEVRTVNTVGSYGLRDSWSRISGTRKRWSYGVSYDHRTGESWRPNSGYELQNVHALIGRELGGRTSITLEYTGMRYVAQQPGGLSDAQFSADPSVSLRARNFFSARWNILALAFDHAFTTRARMNVKAWGFVGSRDALGFVGDINRLDPLDQPRDLIADEYRNGGTEWRYMRRDSIGRTAHAWLVGTRAYRGLTRKAQGWGAEGSGADFRFANPDTLEGSDYAFPGTNIAAFAEDLITLPGGKWRVIPGIRFEHISTRAQGYYRRTLGTTILPGIVEEQRDLSRNFTLLGLGVSRMMGKRIELYANASQNYRGITFTDMRVTRVNQRIDPDLRDERGYNIDLGCKGAAFGWLTWDVSGFLLAYDDRIGLVQQVDELFNVIRYTTNIGASRSVGGEFFAEADALRAIARKTSEQHLVLFASVGVQDARYTASELPGVTGNYVEYAPSLTTRGGITYRDERLSITVQAAHTAGQFTEASNARFTPSAVNGVVPAYTVYDASARWQWRWLDLRIGSTNLFDTVYFTRRATSYPGPGIIPAERRNVHATVGLVWPGK